jgi:hypothetical protein
VREKVNGVYPGELPSRLPTPEGGSDGFDDDGFAHDSFLH